MTLDFAFVAGLVAGLLTGAVAHRAAYCNGVTDGFGFAREPRCPGYRSAGLYLRKYMRHRWRELDNPEYVNALQEPRP